MYFDKDGDIRVFPEDTQAPGPDEAELQAKLDGVDGKYQGLAFAMLMIVQPNAKWKALQVAASDGKLTTEQLCEELEQYGFSKKFIAKVSTPGAVAAWIAGAQSLNQLAATTFSEAGILSAVRYSASDPCETQRAKALVYQARAAESTLRAHLLHNKP